MMRSSIAGAVTLLVGAGVTTAAAVTNGNDLALSGSDTLYDVTQDVIDACGVQFQSFQYGGIGFNGGSSGVGALEMGLGEQDIAPMSRAMKSGEFCTLTPGNAADLLIGVDGISMVTSKSSSCSTSTVNQVGNPSFTYSGGTYTLGAVSGISASLDALRLVYMGIDQHGNVDCGSPVRRALVQNWRNLFTTDPSCPGGDMHCESGLTHAWRLADASGTADAFVGILLAKNGAGRALGTMSNAPTAVPGIDPFCNSFEANDPNHSPQYLDSTGTLNGDGASTTQMTDGRVNDSEDHDPIRTPCDANDTICSASGQCFAQTTQAACVATSAQCQWNSSTSKCSTTNDLGLVLPIFMPDVQYGVPSVDPELYPTATCSGSCALLPVCVGGLLPPGYLCPNGAKPIAARCWTPVIDTAGLDPRCIVTDPTTRCFGSPGSLGQIDSRVYNKATWVMSIELPADYQFGDATFQVALDRNYRLMDGSFYRLHMQTPSSYNTRAPDANYTGTCTQSDNTSQIGCLVDADDCSMGFAGLGAARTFPGQNNVAPPDPNKALRVDTVSPFDPGVLTNLLAQGGTVYELARRLYLATGPSGVGFANLPGDSEEQMLAQCFSKDSLVDVALTHRGYFGIPSTNGGVQCIDYDETKSTSQPPVNVQGSGNVALPGCAASSNTNACTNVDKAHGYLFGE
jgi:hypothetical protein